MDLFDHAQKSQDGALESQPLAERLRPRRLEDMIGQLKILGHSAPWRKLLDQGQIPSMILWGPPGCGKTTFALLLAHKVDAEFKTVNAIETGAKALRELGEAGRRRRLEYGRKTLLFLDEIHRLNKGQQDVLLPFVEKGDVLLVGATTENPSYEINAALLSRCRILVFERLSRQDLIIMADRACMSSQLSITEVTTDTGLDLLLEYADGDGRKLLNALEVILRLRSVSGPEPRLGPFESAQSGLETWDSDSTAPSDSFGATCDKNLGLKSSENKPSQFTSADNLALDFEQHANPLQGLRDASGSSESENSAKMTMAFPLSREALMGILDAPALRYDKSADEHFDTISAFIKSVRGSDPDAAVYYLARMIKGGEDPVFIARRLVILASEDVGNADPRALALAVSGLQAVELVGWPEAAISLAQVTTYLASAPKSNSSYLALQAARDLVERTGTLPIPLSLRSAKTSVMKDLGYGKGYRYSHDGAKGYVQQRFLPAELEGVKLYEPTDHGFEKTIRQYLAWLRS